MKPDDEPFERLLSRYFDGEASEEDGAILTARLGVSSDDLDRFVERLLIEAELIDLGHRRELSRIRGVRLRRLLASAGARSLMAAAAIVAIGFLALSLIKAPAPEPFAEWETSPGSLVSVSGGSDGMLEEGAILTVSQGCAEIRLRDGVRCLLQSPGTLRLVGSGEAHLSNGVARFEVGKEARGYKVVTEELEIIDLGTEFGVDTRDPLRAEVHVVKGRVRVSARSGWKGSTELTAGEAVALGAAGRLDAVPLDSARFLDRLPHGLPALHFSFDEIEDGIIRGKGTIAERDGARIRISAKDAPQSIAGRFGKALAFDGTQAAGSDWPGISGTHPRTVAFWLRIPEGTEIKANPILNWGDGSDPTRMGDFGIRLSGGDGRLRIVSGRRWLESESPLGDGDWHHVAVVFGSYRKGSWPEARLFINGEAEKLIPGEPWNHVKASLDTFSTVIDHPNSQPLSLGRFGDGSKPFLPPLVGELDELIIAEGVITPEQVRALYTGHLEESGLHLDR